MLHIENNNVKKHILEGNFGLEKESLRVLENGTFAHTPHPFPEDEHIVKDFCENQTEINTAVHSSPEEAVEELTFHNERIYEKLQSLPVKEYLWPFSNPPYIENERDIPVAVFEGVQASKSAYRDYLSEKYGRYKMAFCGIHVNYSFSEDLLRADYELQNQLSGKSNNGIEKRRYDFQDYKNQVYLNLAEKLALYGWILVAATAASPVLDSSFVEKGIYDRDVFSGMASVRCSEMGYWNEFTPVLHYENIDAYAKSIRSYVDKGLLKAPSELYYPIRLKPKGENNLERLQSLGVDHIELRMFDLNPLAESGVDERDLVFAQLLMVWLASTPEGNFSQKDQINAVQNFKNAARYDLKTVKIVTPEGESRSVAHTALTVIKKMQDFYEETGLDVKAVLDYQYEKFVDAGNRYAWKIRKQFSDGFVKKALVYAKERQEKKHV